MERELQYPSIIDSERYCPNDGFLLDSYGGECPRCLGDYTFLLSEKHDFKIPYQVNLVSLIATNLQYGSIIFCLLLAFLYPDDFIIIILLFVLLYTTFKKIAGGIKRASIGSYLVLPYFPISLFMLLLVNLLANLRFTLGSWILLVLTTISFIPFLLLYKSPITRNLFNLSDKMYLMLLSKIEFKSVINGKKEKIIEFQKRFVLSFLLIFGIITNYAIFSFF